MIAQALSCWLAGPRFFLFTDARRNAAKSKWQKLQAILANGVKHTVHNNFENRIKIRLNK
jgi:hypothetical protein